MTYIVHSGDALAVLRTIPEESVNCCVTSPPFWGLRDYGVVGQIGLEETPEAYVSHLVEVFREVRRVLRSDGTLWLNLGDSYARMQENNVPQSKNPACTPPSGTGRVKNAGLKPKDLVGIPWRVAFALQADGWWLRSDIIWAKPAPMPESVRDRPTRSHEYIFLLAKSERYWYAPDAISEQTIDVEYRSRGKVRPETSVYSAPCPDGPQRTALNLHHQNGGRLTRNRRDVWTLGPQPLKDAHFAAFPIELPELCIKAGSPEGGVALDPFAGSGTTGLACLKNNRRFIGIELNPEYVELAYRRAQRHYPLMMAAAPVSAEQQESETKCPRSL